MIAGIFICFICISNIAEDRICFTLSGEWNLKLRGGICSVDVNVVGFVIMLEPSNTL